MDVHDLGFEHISMTPEQEQDLAETIWTRALWVHYQTSRLRRDAVDYLE